MVPQPAKRRRAPPSGVSPTMKRCARCLTPPAAAAPSAARPALVCEILIAAESGGGVSGTSSRKLVRWRARSSSERHAGTTSTNRNSAARSSRSLEASSIARASSALTGWRELDGNARHSSAPTRCNSCSTASSLSVVGLAATCSRPHRIRFGLRRRSRPWRARSRPSRSRVVARPPRRRTPPRSPNRRLRSNRYTTTATFITKPITFSARRPGRDLVDLEREQDRGRDERQVLRPALAVATGRSPRFPRAPRSEQRDPDDVQRARSAA